MAATDTPSTQRSARNSSSRPRRLALGAATGVLALGLLAACSSSPKSTSPAPAGGSSVAPVATSAGSSAAGSAGSSAAMPDSAAMIHISSFKYSVPSSVAPGSTISVMNMDGENHTVTADSAHAFDVVATAGQTVTFTAPKAPGSYPFHCTYHSNMHGVLVVK